MKKVIIRLLKTFFKDVLLDAVVDYGQDVLRKKASLTANEIDKLGDVAISIAEVSVGHRATDMNNELLEQFKRSVKTRNVAEFIGKM